MLMVIFGAGASHDSAPALPSTVGAGAAHRPPLAKDLFLPQYLSTQNKFPHCKSLIPFLAARQSDRSVEQILEDFLAEQVDDPHRHAEFLAIRHYIQDVIANSQEHWLAQHGRTTNQLALLGRIELWRRRRNERVSLVTFNYDTLLEEALAARLKIYMRQIGDYISNDHYTLIKLHGSVTWFHEVTSPTFTGDIMAELFDRASEVKLGPGFALLPWQTQGRIPGGPVMVPAIAMPVQRKTVFECPADHVEALRVALPSVTKLMLIGWRAREEQFLDILREALPSSVEAIVVGKDPEDAEKLVTWIREQHLPGTFTPAPLTGFTDFVLLNAADQFLDR